jgi:glycosyltransferase involved in cell wall biosynthesis
VSAPNTIDRAEAPPAGCLQAVTVVVPCFNAARFIGATLRSILAQRVPEMQLIVVDDGSTDGSAEIVERDFPQITVLRQCNQGVAAARNAALAHARNDWVAFCDADDLWLPGKLDAQWRALQAASVDAVAPQMAYTAWAVWNSSEPEPDPAWLAELHASARQSARWEGASGWLYPDLLVDCVVWTSTVLVRRSLLDQVGGFDPALRIGEDWDLWLRLSRVTPIVRVTQPLALYRMHPGSITKKPTPISYRHLVIDRALVRWGLRGPDGRSADPRAVSASLARAWRDRAGAWIQLDEPGCARREAWAAVREQPAAVASWVVWLKSLAMIRRRQA